MKIYNEQELQKILNIFEALLLKNDLEKSLQLLIKNETVSLSDYNGISLLCSQCSSDISEESVLFYTGHNGETEYIIPMQEFIKWLKTITKKDPSYNIPLFLEEKYIS